MVKLTAEQEKKRKTFYDEVYRNNHWMDMGGVTPSGEDSVWVDNIKEQIEKAKEYAPTYVKGKWKDIKWAIESYMEYDYGDKYNRTDLVGYIVTVESDKDLLERLEKEKAANKKRAETNRRRSAELKAKKEAEERKLYLELKAKYE